MPRTDLGGAGILVTRPAHQAAPLITALEAAGAHPLAFPTLEIRPCDPAPSLAQIRRRSWDWFIFVSANAVTHGLPLLRQSGIPFDRANIAAIGRTTADALADAGIKAHVPSKAFNSEALADLPVFQSVSGQPILIFRGNEGREWLRETLLARGAEVEYAECYQRACPQTDPQPVLAACAKGVLHLVSSTSNQGLRNLLFMMPDTHCLGHLPLLVAGERQAKAAVGLGWRGKVLIAADPRPTTLVNTLLTQRDNWQPPMIKSQNT